jgi:hypothetical protein
MIINRYDFGYIEIDGESYSNDIIIYKGNIIKNWWRKRGHYLDINDIDTYIGENWIICTNIVIIGTGESGMMHVSEDLIEFIRGNNIEVFIEKSLYACELFNSLNKSGVNVALFIHLTC